MDKESATPAGAGSNVIKATAHPKEVIREPKDDVIEILKGLVDRLEKMEHRLEKMEEKVDRLISSVTNASMKTGTLKAAAEADNMSVDESSSDDDDEEKPLQKTRTLKKAATTSDSPFGPFVAHSSSLFANASVGSPFRSGEKPSQIGFRTTKNDSRFNPGGYGPTSLNVGGRFSGGRCGGLGQCGFC